MDTLGSEVGQKMRSAVKAKLIELGTGGLSGYIDDELPDYVMIMIANKRSKQQMIGDLQLFLGSQTELFVTWLHEVLHKLQEVTLPAAVVHKKRKSDNSSTPVPGKKEKKEKKKDKDKKHKQKDPEQTTKDTNQPSATTTPSISDFFADHLLQKAKKTMRTESVIPKIKKSEASTSTSNITRDEFDIPTITEISETVEEISNKKDLEELSILQKKIYQVKAKLNVREFDESDDEDCLNIRAEGEELDEEVTEKVDFSKKNKKRNLITFDLNKPEEEKQKEKTSVSSENKQFERGLESSKKRTPISFSNEKNETDAREKKEFPRKRPIHERLGFNAKNVGGSVSNQVNYRRPIEKESPLPTLRPRSIEKNPENHQHSYTSRNEDKERIKQREKVGKEEPVTMRRRIGSRVIVATPKKVFEEDDNYNETSDKVVSSMIKIKPRPSISPSKQASKNLLLRAVAEAQRSTASVQPKKDPTTDRSSKKLTPTLTRDQQKLKMHGNIFQNRRTHESIIKKIVKDNIVIEIKSNKNVKQSDYDEDDDDIDKSEDEYIPEPIYYREDSDSDYVYIPQTINFDTAEDTSKDYDDEEEQFPRNKTQFVVTLDDKAQEKYVMASQSRKPQRNINKSLNGIERNKLNINSSKNSGSNLKATSNSSLSFNEEGNSKQQHDNSNSKYSQSNQPQEQIYKKSEHSNVLSKPKEVKKIIISNDSEDDDDTTKINCEIDGSLTPPLPPTTLKQLPIESSSLKRKRSPIKFDIKEKDNGNISKEIESSSSTNKESKNSTSVEETNQKISIKKLEATKKYDNIPEFLSSVAIEAPNKPKVKERCKYFPSCGKGDSCEYFHPTTSCKAFPNCKFADKCLYLHPKCKFDLTCTRVNCNFSHSAPIAGGSGSNAGAGGASSGTIVASTSSAPPLSSHVVPVQNYKSISANALPAICKYYPNCTNSLCTFYHPKLCRFGKNCMNKIECNFYHFDLPIKDKFKWVASLG